MIKMKIEQITRKVPYGADVATSVYECCNNYMIKVQDLDEYKSEFTVPAWNNATHLEIRQGMNKVILNDEVMEPGVKCAILLHEQLLHYGEITEVVDNIAWIFKGTNEKNYALSIEDIIKGTI